MPAIFTEWAALIHRAIDRRNIFSETLLLGTYLGSSISGATRRDGNVKERENNAPFPEDGVSALKLSRIHNHDLNFKNQRLASRSHSHPSTMCPGIFLNTL